jgi:hypothetical protein
VGAWLVWIVFSLEKFTERSQESAKNCKNVVYGTGWELILFG